MTQKAGRASRPERGPLLASVGAPMRAATIAAAVLLSPLAWGGAAPALAQVQASTASQTLFVVIYRPGPAWREGVPMRAQGLGPHGAYMQRLLDEGRLVAAGGFADDDGGMAVLRCADLAEAQALMGADPAVVSGIFIGDVEQWGVRFRAEGALPREG